MFWGALKITVDGEINEMKRCMPCGRRAMPNQDCILKSGDITLPTRVHIDKAIILPVVAYKCELDHKED